VKPAPRYLSRLAAGSASAGNSGAVALRPPRPLFRPDQETPISEVEDFSNPVPVDDRAGTRSAPRAGRGFDPFVGRVGAAVPSGRAQVQPPDPGPAMDPSANRLLQAPGHHRREVGEWAPARFGPPNRQPHDAAAVHPSAAAEEAAWPKRRAEASPPGRSVKDTSEAPPRAPSRGPVAPRPSRDPDHVDGKWITRPARSDSPALSFDYHGGPPAEDEPALVPLSVRAGGGRQANASSLHPENRRARSHPDAGPGPARLTIGTIEVNVVPPPTSVALPAPVPPVSHAVPSSHPNPSGSGPENSARRGSRRWFGTGQG
jgi:hypothetical protein